MLDNNTYMKDSDQLSFYLATKIFQRSETHLKSIEICEELPVFVFDATFHPHDKFNITSTSNVHFIANVKSFCLGTVAVMNSHRVYNILDTCAHL